MPREWPATFEAAVAGVLRVLTPTAQAELRALTRAELGRTHFGLGLWIRNNFGLWQGNRALLAACGEEAERSGESFYFVDADGASALIIEGVWQALRAAPAVAEDDEDVG